MLFKLLYIRFNNIKKKNRFKGGYNMSAYAYRDRNRTEVIYASEAMKDNIDTHLF